VTDILERRFETDADAWDRSYNEQSPDAHRIQSRLDAALSLIGSGPGQVLDVGAGSGRLLTALDNRGWTVHGVDPVPRMVELARTRIPDAADRLLVGNAEKLPYADETFDVVAIIGVLEYTRADVALAELGRVLRASGKAVIGLYGCRAPATVWQRRVVLPLARRVKEVLPLGRPLPSATHRPVSLEDAIDLLHQAGLIVEAIVRVGAQVIPDPFDRLAPALAYRVARRVERSPRLRRAFATQRLIVARKP
jgi:SAM-dependent methyltransferase